MSKSFVRCEIAWLYSLACKICIFSNGDVSQSMRNQNCVNAMQRHILLPKVCQIRSLAFKMHWHLVAIDMPRSLGIFAANTNTTLSVASCYPSLPPSRGESSYISSRWLTPIPRISRSSLLSRNRALAQKCFTIHRDSKILYPRTTLSTPCASSWKIDH